MAIESSRTQTIVTSFGSHVFSGTAGLWCLGPLAAQHVRPQPEGSTFLIENPAAIFRRNLSTNGAICALWPFSQWRTTRTIHITQNRSHPIITVTVVPKINIRVGASSSNRLLTAKSEPATKDSWSGFISATRLIPFGSGPSHLPSAVLNPVIVCVDRVIT